MRLANFLRGCAIGQRKDGFMVSRSRRVSSAEVVLDDGIAATD